MRPTALMMMVFIGMLALAGAVTACAGIDDPGSYEDGEPVPLGEDGIHARCSPVVDDRVPEELGPIAGGAFVMVLISLVAFAIKSV